MKSLGTLAAAIAILTVPACNDAGNADQAASADASPSADATESADAVQPCEWTGEHIFHLALRHGLTGDRDSAIALARRVLEQRS